MSVKLSELLEAGAAALYAAGEAAEDLELFDFVKPYKDKACAVRAIAPALVEGLQTLLSQCPYSRARVVCDCAGCTLLVAMKKAGVTCE